MSKIWFITGANRGLGKAIAQAALTAGHRVAATARRLESLAALTEQHGDLVLPLALDVRNPADVQHAVDRTVQQLGSIDVLVNNAGYGQIAPFEQITADEIEQQFATNVFGLMHVTRAVLPTMRHQRRGHIFNVSSMGGYKGDVGGSAYSASKFAVTGFSESLAPEVAGFGIHVTNVAPGLFRTDFLDTSSAGFLSTEPIDDYTTLNHMFQTAMGQINHAQPGDPAKLGRALVELSETQDPPLHFPIGDDAMAFVESNHAAMQVQFDHWRGLSSATAITD